MGGVCGGQEGVASRTPKGDKPDKPTGKVAGSRSLESFDKTPENITDVEGIPVQAGAIQLDPTDNVPIRPSFAFWIHGTNMKLVPGQEDATQSYSGINFERSHTSFLSVAPSSDRTLAAAARRLLQELPHVPAPIAASNAATLAGIVEEEIMKNMIIDMKEKTTSAICCLHFFHNVKLDVTQWSAWLNLEEYDMEPIREGLTEEWEVTGSTGMHDSGTALRMVLCLEGLAIDAIIMLKDDVRQF